ncbi:MAG: hypothetical protein HFJ29_00885 [Clostridia bacterium]|nr:hypothetical protein [Clostridia bacterium]
MERIFIDREWCINYVLLAFDNVDNSTNKERTIQEFLEEIRNLFNAYTDETKMIQTEKEILKRIGKKKITCILLDVNK